jgi:formamidopyrimidine-DNA glycosylase
MPELPEVEVVRQGLQQTVLGQRLSRVVIRNRALRWPIVAGLETRIAGLVLRQVRRRSKYLLLDLGEGTLIVHLGMSGSLQRVAPQAPVRNHDHVDLIFDRATLRYHDPRRFGAMLWHEHRVGDVLAHRLLACLGIEPFDVGFDGMHLKRGLAGRRVSIKQALLAGQVVVGVGNIYASESLFRAGIRPQTAAYRLSLQRCERLAQAIKQTLVLAIERGGSSLRDFVSSAGEPGHFQLEALVYGRAGQACRSCGEPIRRLVQQGRATYWCPRCQH